MKKKYLLIIALLTSMKLFSQEYKILNDFHFMYHCDWPLKIVGGQVYNDWSRFGSSTFPDDLVKSISINVNENGFLEIIQNGQSSILLDNRITYITFIDEKGILEKNIIKALIADGNFSEKISGKTVNYSVENLRNAVVWGAREEPYWYNNNNIPFVTKRGKSGIGEKIKIEFVKPQNEISILGGYVNVKRQDLFKSNNRLKKIRIADLDSNYSIECNFEDIAMFHTFEFATEIKNMEIEILEVYKGTKYDDTCISGLMVWNF